jgi:hypothetical protein
VAARKNAGERRGGTGVDQRANEWVGQLQGDDVVLATVLCWRGRARVELSTVRPRTAAAALVGNEVPVEIGWPRVVEEH